MSEHQITVEGGTSVRLPTAGKYCDRDIIITAPPGGVELPTLDNPAAEDEVFAGEEYIDGTGTKKTGTFTVEEEVAELEALAAELEASLEGKIAAGGGTDDRFDALIDGSITEIDSSVTKVRTYGFYGMTSITSVNLPECTTINSRAFQNCGKITSFNAPKVTTLGTYCFYGNNGMTEYNFPLASTVPNNAFYICAGLVKADFGVAKSIGSYAFYSCAKLATLILRKSDAIVTLQSNSLTSSGIARGTGYVYVPAALVDSYKAATNWSTYADQFRAIEDYPDITGG